MGKNNYNPNSDYLVMGNDGLMDISSGKPVAAEGYMDGFNPGNGGDLNPNGRKKKIIIISCVAAAVVVALGAAGVLLFQMNKQPETTEKGEFLFSENTVISGIDISGRTYEQAKKLLERNEDKFITPVTFDININGKDFQLKEADFSYTYNIDEVLAKVKSDEENGESPTATTSGNSYTVTATVTEDSIMPMSPSSAPTRRTDSRLPRRSTVLRSTPRISALR